MGWPWATEVAQIDSASVGHPKLCFAKTDYGQWSEADALLSPMKSAAGTGRSRWQGGYAVARDGRWTVNGRDDTQMSVC